LIPNYGAGGLSRLRLEHRNQTRERCCKEKPRSERRTTCACGERSASAKARDRLSKCENLRLNASPKASTQEKIRRSHPNCPPNGLRGSPGFYR
jgi:hypothetical protein